MKNRKWKVIYYETKDGKCPVIDFVESRSKRNQAKTLGLFALLQKKGPLLPRPYADLLEDGIHELRLKLSGGQVRVLYFFCYKKYIVLTHSFIKSTKRVPKAEIKKAEGFREDFLERFTKEHTNENIR